VLRSIIDHHLRLDPIFALSQDALNSFGVA
jgi:hypothetical protein